MKSALDKILDVVEQLPPERQIEFAEILQELYLKAAAKALQTVIRRMDGQTE